MSPKEGMEANTPMSDVTDEKLLAAGASELFVRYFNTAPESASARHEIETGRFSLSELGEQPALGGGFFEALWNGEERSAVRRADGRNRGILKDTPGVRVHEHVY